MTIVTISNSECRISAEIVPTSPRLDRLSIVFGPAYLAIWEKGERKAFIAALQEADSELDAAEEARNNEQVAE
jgi:hypothetical protein